MSKSLGETMHAALAEAFPICRSITGDGVRQTLKLLGKILPLQIHEVPTGTPVLDWQVPQEWNIRDAYVVDEHGARIIDFKRNNLHVVGYSVPVDQWLDLDELDAHLHSLPDQPDAIPYITSYYKERWGFCLTHNDRQALRPGRYRAVIDSELKQGHLTYAECLIPGASTDEVFISTYVCHPSMANNELSGPIITAFIGDWLASQPRRYSYRIAFVPETIGSITYLSKNLKSLQQSVRAGFNLTCIGDEGGFSYVQSRYGNTFADKVVRSVLNAGYPGYIDYSYLARGSDERQYCSPGVDLPLVTLCRSKFREYPEYHTSLDNLEFVTPAGLAGGFSLIKDCIEVIERNKTYRVLCLGEPQLGRRGLYPTLSTRDANKEIHTLLDVLAYSDGTNDLIAICDITGAPFHKVADHAKRLCEAQLLEEVGHSGHDA